MTTRKMIVCAAVGALVVALMLVGCGGSQSSSSASAAGSTSASATATSTSAAAASTSAAATSASAAAASTSAAAASASAAAPAAAASATAPAASASAAAPAAAPAAATADRISREQARDIALQHAGVAESACTKLEIELDTDEIPVHYDVDFKAGGMEYDYDIDAATGDILQSKSEPDDND